MALSLCGPAAPIKLAAGRVPESGPPELAVVQELVSGVAGDVVRVQGEGHLV